jgi:hypothetical protein
MTHKTEIGNPTCGQCGLSRTSEGHDGCLGRLPGDVVNACCGHNGHGEGAYIQYSDGRRIDDADALSEFKALGRGFAVIMAHRRSYERSDPHDRLRYQTKRADAWKAAALSHGTAYTAAVEAARALESENE